MVSGHDIAESEGAINGIWSNSSVMNTAASVYHVSQRTQDQNSTAGPSSSSTTDSPIRSATHGTMQDNTSEPRTSPARTTSIAINTTPAPSSLAPEESSINTTGRNPGRTILLGGGIQIYFECVQLSKCLSLHS